MAFKSESPASRQTLDEIGLSNLPTEWDIVRIGELLSKDRGIAVGVMYPGESQHVGIPLIRAGDLASNRLLASPSFKITEAKHHEYRRTALDGGELLVSLVGDVGRSVLVTSKMIGWNVARAIAVLRFVDPSDAPFVRACLMSSPLQHLMQAWSNTTVQPTLNLKEIRQMPLPWPRAVQRQRIIEILRAFEDKLLLHHEMMANLELISRTLFKSWFVDFDPVRAKAEGREPDGMDAATAALFPSAFSESNLGPVPAGWNITTWGTLATLKYGKSLRDYTSTSGAYPVYGTNGKIGTCSEPLCSSAGIIIGRKGAYRGVHYSSMPFFVIDTAFYVALNASIESRWCYYSLLRQDINEIDSGSAIPSTSREDFYSLKVVAPPTALQQAFVEFLEPFWQRQEHANRESAVLGEVRDTLLPRLISGKLRVPEAEKLVEAVL
jgi:type I restriction enzyme, S subunit